MLRLWLLLLPLFAIAAPLRFDFFADKPRSITKDYYIWRYLERGCTPEEARALVGEVAHMNAKLFAAFAKRLHDPAFSKVAECRTLAAKAFAQRDASCVMIGLTLAKASRLDPPTLERIAQAIKPSFPERARLYRLIATRSCRAWFRASPTLFIRLFNGVGADYRRHYCNKLLPASMVATLAAVPAFSRSIALIVRDPQLDQLHRSILQLDPSALDAEADFLLALNALGLEHPDIALSYLKRSQKRARHPLERHRAQLWCYLITQDRALLRRLADAPQIDLYTLYAKEQLNLPITGIVTAIEPKRPVAPFDITDPFVWLALKARKSRIHDSDELQRWAIGLNAPDTEPHVAALLYGYAKKERIFLMPYSRYMQGIPKKRQALIYALARQESRFIPTEVSVSYALGMMQFMPFVARDIARRQGWKGYDDRWMFDPQKAIRFADVHLQMLQKRLASPLFVAYAYNAGLGFTTRSLLKRGYFMKGAYEPFYSMEMMPNAQARRYGKRVLANYVIYRALLGDPVSLTSLLRSAVSPFHTDRSRR